MTGPVTYDSSKFFGVVFQRHGSIWPSVLPYCIANVVLMLLLKAFAGGNESIELGISGKGHTFAGMIVSFLLVSRINTATARYDVGRNQIGTMYRETRELVQNAVVLSRRSPKNHDDFAAKDWRKEVAYRALCMLRTAVSVIEYRSYGKPAWEASEICNWEQEFITPKPSWRKYQDSAAGEPTDFTDSMKAPFGMAYLLRSTIVSQDTRLKEPIHIVQETKLLGQVDSFMTGYHGLRKLLTTPVPFPIIQMTLTMVVVYVFTLPLVFLSEPGERLWEHCVQIFLITYGFMGLELVSVSLDDPFGTDPNDFDVLRFAKVVIEDTYLIIFESDGEEWADMLREKMTTRKLVGPMRPEDERGGVEVESPPLADEKTPLQWSEATKRVSVHLFASDVKSGGMGFN